MPLDFVSFIAETFFAPISHRFNPHSRLRRVTLPSLVVCLAASHLHAQQPPSPASLVDPAKKVALAHNYGKIPLSFEANQGQTDPQVRFLSRGNGYSLFLTDSAAVLSLHKPDPTIPLKPAATPHLARKQPAPITTDVVRMELAGASRDLRIAGDSQLPGTANYFIGNDPVKWHSSVSTYARVKYEHVYPGVDLVYYGNQSQLEYDFIVAPNADPKPIKLHFSGASKLKLAASGDLEVIGRSGQIAFHKPVVYQEIAGHRKEVEGSFHLLAKNTVAFTLGTYDHSQSVVIDPTLIYSTYLGGTGNGSLLLDTSQASAIAVDTTGNVYLTGTTSSLDFPITSGAFETVSNQGKINYVSTYSFIAKLDPTGSTLLYSTYIGGSGQVVPTTSAYATFGDSIYGIAVDAAGNAFVTGLAASPDFPVTPGAFQSTHNAVSNGDASGFITKLNPTGSALVYSTYLGGGGYGDFCNGIAIDASGNAYVVGDNGATDFPVTSNVLQGSPAGMFVTKINPSGTGLLYSTYFGSAFFNQEVANSIAIDSLGNAYIAGQTASPNFPVTTNAFQKVNKAFAANGMPTAFVAKIDPTGSTAPYVTLLGGSGSGFVKGGDEVFGIAVNTAGEAYVTGITGSQDFPTSTNAIQTTNRTFPLRVINPPVAHTNAFVTKLNTAGSDLKFSTYLGSENGELMLGSRNIALDSANNVYVTGTTYGTELPVTSNAIQGTNNSAGHSGNIYAPTTAVASAFLSKLGEDGSLIYSSYFGGSGLPVSVYSNGAQYPSGSYLGDDGVSLALDATGAVYLAGNAFSKDLAVTPGAYQVSETALETAYVAKFDLSTAVSAATVTTVLSDANPQNSMVKVTFTARVQSVSGTGVPTGQVSFSVDGAAGTSVTLDNKAQATFTASTLSSGSHTVAVDYLGDSTYSASTGRLTQVVDNGSSSIASVSGDGQSTPYLSSFPKPLVILVKDSSGNPVPGVVVEFKGTGLTFLTHSGLSGAVLTGFDGTAAIGVIASARGALTAVATVYGTSVAPTFFSLNSTTGVLTVTASNATVSYGQPIPAFSYAITGFNPGDTESIVTGQPAETSPASQTSAPGNYPITISEGSLAATGYSFTFVNGTLTIHSAGTTATPTFSPAAGTYSSAQSVTISDATPAAVIYYTTDGTTPTTSSTKYTGAITVSASETVQAIATAAGYMSSPVASAAYTINTPVAVTPTFSPAAGTYTAAQSVTITDATPGAAIYYTVDGTTPTTASTKYAGAIAVSTSQTIEAIAFATNYTPSTIATAAYTISLPAATFALTASPASATVAAGQSATYTLTVTPQNNFVQPIAFACPGLASSLQCTFAPATVTPAGSPVTSILTVSTTTAVANAQSLHLRPWKAVGGVVMMSLLLWPFHRRRRYAGVVFAFFLVAGNALIGCGSKTTNTPVSQSQSYTVSVTATGGGISQSSTLSLTVTK